MIDLLCHRSFFSWKDNTLNVWINNNNYIKDSVNQPAGGNTRLKHLPETNGVIYEGGGVRVDSEELYELPATESHTSSYALNLLSLCRNYTFPALKLGHNNRIVRNHRRQQTTTRSPKSLHACSGRVSGTTTINRYDPYCTTVAFFGVATTTDLEKATVKQYWKRPTRSK